MLFEVCVIDADPPFFIWFLHHYYISEPFRVVNFLYEFSYKELFDLLADRHVTFRVKPSTLLDNKFVCKIDIKPVHDD